MLVGMGLSSFIGVHCRLTRMAAVGVRMVGGFLMMASVVVLCRFAMMLGGLAAVL